MKEFNQYVVLTPGNAGTLDMLNRGEIAMGPVWVDMFYTWQADGRMSPKIKLTLPSPGLPGQPIIGSNCAVGLFWLVSSLIAGGPEVYV